MAKLYNRARVTVSSTGTGTLTLSTAVAGYQTFTSAGVQNGDIVSYVIEDGLNWEIGTGTFTTSTNTLTRTVTQSFNGSTYGTAAISVTASAQVFISPLAADLSLNGLPGSPLSVANGGTGLTSLTAGYIPFGAGTSAFGSSANLIWDSANSQLDLAAGSQTVPALSTLGDNNTGLFFPAADTAAIATGGSERWRIDASGNVGIGTASPGAKLEVVGTFSIRTSYPTFAYLDTVAGASNGGFARFTANGLGTYIYQINTAVAGDFSTVINAIAIDKNGNVLNTGTGGLGYGTGSGGAVTQLTSRTTGVTLNKTNGAITLFSAAGVTTATTFTVTNSTVAATDVILVNQKSGTNLYNIIVTAVAAGSFNITFYTTGGIATDAPVFSFAVIKAVTA